MKFRSVALREHLVRISGHGDCSLTSGNVLNDENNQKIANLTSSKVLNVEINQKIVNSAQDFWE